jgi:hypothetical protein
MARRIINQGQVGEPADEKADTMPGGAMGIAESAVPELKPVARDPEELAKLPPVKIYRVAATRQVLYGGVPTMLRAGKTVSDATHDLQSLRMQGVALEEIPHGG